MASDIVFKSKVFGGFNKEEVMAYINTLLSEKKDLESQITSMNSTIAQLNVKLSVLEFRANESEGLKERNTALTTENKNLKSQLSEIDTVKAKYEELKAEAEKDKNQCQLLRAELASKESSPEEVDDLKSEIKRLTSENIRMKNMEQQVGAAMLDARIHSEELVNIAREKADRVTREIYSAIGDTALKIDGLSSDIGEIARNFTKAAEEIELRINVLTGNMSKTAQSLLYENTVLQEANDMNVREPQPQPEKPLSREISDEEFARYLENFGKKTKD